jgi:O-methyltransferase
MIKKILNYLLSIIGYSVVKEINNPSHPSYGLRSGYEGSVTADPYIKVVRKNSMVPYINLLTLFEQVVFCEKNAIEGDYVECGVWKGGAIGLMALINIHYGRDRRDIHLFDVFDDICSPDQKVDGEKALSDVVKFSGQSSRISGELIPLKGFYKSHGGAGTLEENKRLLEEIIMYPKERLYYHKGWFQETIPESSKEINKIAILRLDGDWYASTKICLDFLYDKVVKGGFIIIDDYGCYEGCKKAVDEFLNNRGIITFLNYSNTSCRYWIKN